MLFLILYISSQLDTCFFCVSLSQHLRLTGKCTFTTSKPRKELWAKASQALWRWFACNFAQTTDEVETDFLLVTCSFRVLTSLLRGECVDLAHCVPPIPTQSAETDWKLIQKIEILWESSSGNVWPHIMIWMFLFPVLRCKKLRGERANRQGGEWKSYRWWGHCQPGGSL